MEYTPLTGRCTCRTITYTLLAPPLFTHCCHCTFCQRESGSAFALNCMLESYNMQITSDTQPQLIETPSESGKGQIVARCPNCQVAVFSYYGGLGKAMTFIKVGTLEDDSKERVKPNVHIFTSTKVEWIDLNGEIDRGAKVFEEYYDKNKEWSKESLERRAILLKRIGQEKNEV
ncbi:hypothetical protein CC78DRAFT_557054 [Lojkania enalia]|uniref:CENP-V/GFA domain-containing protein n=1 Tax=Lojkania enalia TaxID=147567 RepID=A0A9P4NCV5_9PLEO|nr:hypothetical protein CC78DRAFT_557054 [Didymosphaeria enalia]